MSTKGKLIVRLDPPRVNSALLACFVFLLPLQAEPTKPQDIAGKVVTVSSVSGYPLDTVAHPYLDFAMTTPRAASILPGLFVCFLLLGSTNAGASVTYTYQGNPLTTNFSAPLTVGDSVSGSITFAGSIATGTFITEDFLDYQFGIGGFQLSKTDGAITSARFEIDGAGAITSWSFVIANYASASPPRLVEIWINSVDLEPGQERILMTDSAGGTNLASAATPGTWTLAPVPEPASAALFALSAVALFVRRRCSDRG